MAHRGRTTRVRKVAHPWGSLCALKTGSGRAGLKQVGLEAGAMLQDTSLYTWTWEGCWERVQRKTPFHGAIL